MLSEYMASVPFGAEQLIHVPVFEEDYLSNTKLNKHFLCLMTIIMKIMSKLTYCYVLQLV